MSVLRKVPGKPAYRYGTYEGTDGVFRLPGKDGPPGYQEVLPWIPEVVRYIVLWDSKGKILNARYTLAIGGQEDTIDADELGQAEAWKRWPGAVGVHDRNVREVLAIVVQDQAAGKPPTPEAPYWKDDELIFPGADLMARGYGERFHVPEELDELLSIAARNPKLALVLGFSFGAPYVEPLNRQPFWVHSSGDSSMGKTTGLLAAASLHGRPGRKGVNRPWNVTSNGIGLFLGQLAVLPAFMDELHMAGFTPAALKKTVHTTCDGADRFTSSRTRKLKESPAWYGVLFSTGNLSVTGMCPQAEIAARVVEIPAPVTDSSETSKRVKQLARENYGWWRPVTLAVMKDAITTAENLIGLPEDGGATERIVENLALGVAGAWALGGKVLADAALTAARSLLAVQVEELKEEGLKPSEKLLETLRQVVASRPFNFPTRAEYESWTVSDKPVRFELEGFRNGSTVHVLTKNLERIAKEAGLDNYRIALRELRETGALRPGPEAGRLRDRFRLPGQFFQVYTIELDHPSAHENAKTTGHTGHTGHTEGVSAGQPDIQPVPGLYPVDPPTGHTGHGPGHTSYVPPIAYPQVGDVLEPVPAPVPGPVPGPVPAPVPGPRGAHRAQQRAALAEQVANFHRVIERSERYADVTGPDLLAGLKTFSAALDGLSFGGNPARVGQLLFEKLGAAYASVPALGTPPDQPVPVEHVQTMFNLLDKSADVAGRKYVVGLDVNAQFLAAAGTVALGTGEPVPTVIANLAEVLKFPGYVRLAAPVEVGPGCVIPEGRWIAHPMAAYLLSRDGTLPVTSGYHWPEQRRWLNLWVSRVRTARTALLAREDLPSALALHALKAMYAAFLGGWMNSGESRGNHNQTNTLRPDWMHMVHSTARANMLRALAKSSVAPFATLADAAYFLTDEVMEPRGLEISTAPEWKAGKWKPHRVGLANHTATIQIGRSWRNTTLAEQVERGSLGNVSKVIKSLSDEYRGVRV